MAQFDLPLEDLRAYRYHRGEPAGLDAFWARTLEEARTHDSDVTLTPVDTPLTTLDVSDVSFAGFGGERVRGWLVRPAGAAGALPVAIEYIGYGGGRGRPWERLMWASSGFAHLVVDTRGQGGVWNVGDTADPHGTGSSSPGFLTKGIDSIDDYYYRRVYTDAVRAVDAARSLPGADPARVVVTGSSQGGAIALAAAALSGGVAAVAARVPYLCGVARAVVVTDRDPYAELRRYLGVHRERAEAALSVVDHVDNAFLAARITCPAWFSVGLMDDVCPPSSIFAAINAMTIEPDVVVHPYNGHEGGGIDDDGLAVAWARRVLGVPRSASAAP